MRMGCPDRVAAEVDASFGCEDSMRVSMERSKVSPAGQADGTLWPPSPVDY